MNKDELDSDGLKSPADHSLVEDSLVKDSDLFGAVDFSQLQKLDTYKIATLMEHTRLVAADYRNSTGQALPVTAELAIFDAIDKLNLKKVENQPGWDASDRLQQDYRFLIKGRVIFKGGKARQKLGKLNMEADWNQLLMVIYDADYQPTQIFQIDRSKIEQALAESPADKRGSMTVAKYKAIGQLVWELAS